MKFDHNKNAKKTNVPAPNSELSENRLKAFGINPKKFKNKIKYGAKNQQNNQQNRKGFNSKKKT